MAEKRPTTHARVYVDTQEAVSVIASVLNKNVADVYDMAVRGQFGDVLDLVQKNREKIEERLKDMGFEGDSRAVA